MEFQERRIEPITRQAFAPFGDLIEADEKVRQFPINYGHTQRYHDLAKIDVTAEDGHAIVSIFRSQPLPVPIQIKLLERHPLSSQTFMPLGPDPYLVVVAPAGELDESLIRVFLAEPGQGVNYHAGTWHHFCLALFAESDFLVIDRGGEGENCDEQELKSPFSIELAGIVP